MRKSTILLVVAVLLVAAVLASPLLADGSDRILWSVQTAGTIPNAFLAVAPDGTLYAADNLGLYAFEPDGTQRWFTPGVGGDAPISLGADGTIYTGGALVTAVRPDGTVKWVFDANEEPLCLLAGPNVGPDGNIYAVEDTVRCDGLGAFALDPQGNLLWSHPGDPLFLSFPGSSGNIVFTADRLFAGVIVNAGSPPEIWAYDLGGMQIWNSGNLGLAVGGMPIVDPFGRIVVRWGQVGIQVLSDDGDILWISTHPHGGSLLTGMTVDAAGTIYTGDWLDIDLWALEPDGSTLWSKAPGEDSGLLNGLSIAPDESVLVMSGGGSFGESGDLRGYDPGDGSLMWQVPFPLLEGQLQLIWTVNPAYSPDGTVAYITTRDTGDPEFSLVYAVDITGRDIDPGAALSISGSCPGAITVEVTQMTPNGKVRLMGSTELGDGFLQQGTCAGTRTGFDQPVSLGGVTADATGTATLSRNVSQGACDLYVQAIDMTTCSTTNVLPLP